MIHDLAIIGAGPAGLSAAIYAGRAQLTTLLFGDETKSNLYKAHVIGNYLGMPDEPTGATVAAIGLRQALAFGALHHRSEIVDLSISEDGLFVLKDSGQNIFKAHTVIIATGQSYLLAGIQGEQEFTGKGVSYCVTCDGYFYRNKKILIIGNGDYAAEEALQLLGYSQDIQILSQGKQFTISGSYREELQKQKIPFLVTPRISSICGQEKVEKVTFTSSLQDGQTEMSADGIFMATGIAGANAFARKLGLEMEKSYIKTDREGKTNIKGLFAAGDCTGAPAQVATSVGNGCNAALAAIKLIRGLHNYIQYN